MLSNESYNALDKSRLNITTSFDVSANSQNPYDFVGKIHNEYCMALLEKYMKSSLYPKTIHNILVDDFGLNNKVAFYWEEVYLANAYAIKHDNKDYHEDLQHVFNVNRNFKLVDSKLEFIIRNPLLGLYDIINEIKRLESQLTAYSAEELSIIYQVTSVARHSTYLWYTSNYFEEIINENSASKGPARKTQIKTHEVILSDFKGLWLGGIFGGVAGGLAGFVGGSVGNVISQALS